MRRRFCLMTMVWVSGSCAVDTRDPAEPVEL